MLKLSEADLNMISVALTFLPHSMSLLQGYEFTEDGMDHLRGLIFRVNDELGYIDDELEELLGD